MEQKELLFVYGPLKSAAVQRKVFGKPKRSGNDILDGYSASEITVGGRKCPAASGKDCSFIRGKVIEVSFRELERADRFKTRAFVRRRATLRSGRRAWVYLKSDHDSDSTPHHPRFCLDVNSIG